ncbi:LytTR family DNA-binding domain-containing protein [Spirosoma agri]|uniref:LytTR family transcriptional regulator n=1 Tax=Spirosoma agri TaxID=1987381 RepID=A0A6M0IKG3_9BACT|nr:LytTR family DNA-binding domain-containing protein [Spirosoma agri]NEU67433.1 LytTR family transcriptional regulator [Spirosoma agri]
MKASPGAGVRHNLDTDQIIAITADINYSYVYMLNGDCLHRSRTLKWYLDRWPHLLRIHKNALINIDYVQSYSLTGGKQPVGFVVMKNNLRLEVSRRNIKAVGQVLGNDE